MKRSLFYLAVVCLVLFMSGQANASSVSAKVSPEYAPDTVLMGDQFFVDIYLYNEFSEQIGTSIPFYFYSPDGSISNVTHSNAHGSVVYDWRLQDTLRDSSVVTKNGWLGYWAILAQYYSFSWDGALPDTINFTSASLFGWPTDAAPTNYYSFAFESDEAGTFCIDSCSIPGVTPAGKFDWLFDDPTFNFNGPYCFTVLDTAAPTNQPPVLGAIGNKEGNEGALLTFTVTATDPDGTFPMLSTTELPTGAGFVDNEDGTGTFTWTPTFDQAGDYPVTFYASDGEFVDEEAITITINNVNRAPVFNAVDPQSTDENVELTFGVTATDPDGGALTLTADVPAGAGFTDNGDGTGSFAWTPGYDAAGDYTATFYVSDGTLSDTLEVAITVNNVNRAPEFAAVDPQSTDENVELTFGVTATDLDGEALTLTADVPAGAEFTDNGNGTGSFAWTPGYDAAGDYTATFYASDGDLADTLEVAITVNNVNQAPVLDQVADGVQFVTEGDTLTLPISASDPDGNIPLLSATGLAANMVFVDSLNGKGSFVFAPDMTQAGDYEITVIASDGDLADSELVNITVNDYEAPSELVVDTTTRMYSLTEGETIPDSIFVQEKNGRTISYSLTGSDDWIMTTDTVFDTPGYGFFAISAFGLTEGHYEGTMTISAPDATNSPMVIDMVLDVSAPTMTELVVSPTEFNYTISQTDTIGDYFTVYEASGANVPFAYSNSQPWLNLLILPEAPTTPDSISFYIAPGLDPGTYYDTIVVTTSVEPNNTPINIPVTVTVEETPPAVLTVAPEFFEYNVMPNDTLTDSFFVSEESGMNVEFAVTNLTGWLMLPEFFTPPVTPTTINFGIATAGMDPGTYYDTITVTALDDGGSTKIIPVMLTIGEVTTYELGSGPTSFSYTLNAGDTLGDSLHVFEVGGGNIPVTFSNGTDWLILPPTEEINLTPYTLFFMVDATGLEPGDYVDTIMVMSEEATNSPLLVPVFLTVEGTTEYQIATYPTFFNQTVEEGSFRYDSLYVFETSGANVPFGFVNTMPWLTIEPLGMPPYVTPYSLMLVVNTEMLDPGVYADTIYILPGVYTNLDPDTIKVPYTLTVTPSGPETTDSVWVSTVPGVPGNDVVVPVYFRNFEVLQAVNLPLTWSSSDIHLNSVTFDGTRVSYVDNKPVVIDNATRRVQIGIVPTFSENIVPGRGMLAKLHFTIEEGATEAFVGIDTTSIVPEGGLFFVDDLTNIIHPTYIPGGVVIDTSTGYVCGRVVDTEGNEIEGATVELWDDFPGGGLMLTDYTDVNGQFACHTSGVSPFDAYAYKDGYYPGLVEDIHFGEIGIEIVLSKVPKVTPTPEWVNFYCNDNYFYGVPLPVGSVVDAYDTSGVHCGTYFVTEAGSYGLMPVYRDDEYTPEDEGADPGEEIKFFINGYPANASGEAIWTENGASFEVCLDIFSVEEKMIAFREGWNLISWNVDTPEDDLQTLLAPIWDCVEVVMGFEQGGKTYDPDLPEFSTLWSIDHFHGYWVKMSCADTLYLTGTPIAATTPINLTAGWNLVSYLPNEADSTPHALYSIVDTSLIVALGFDGGAQTYDPSLPEYSTLPVMQPGFGYWLKVYGDCSLVYPGVGPTMVFRQTFARANKAIMNRDMTTSRLWMNIYSYELTLDDQPVPAGSEVTIMAADGSTVGFGTVSDNGTFGFVPVYGDDPATAEVEGIRKGDEFSVVIDGIETNETFVWSETGEKLEIGALTARTGGGMLPDEFGLGQNYPNPFNPTTTISFSVPMAMNARVEVFNVLGEKVSTVFDGMANAGRNDVVWDGVNDAGETVASGIYFYRMKAGEYTESRKMVLMK